MRAVVLDRVRRSLAEPETAAELARAASYVTSGSVDAYRAADAVLDWLRHHAAQE